MTIEVTLNDIQLGSRSSSTQCPVANALRRMLKVDYVCATEKSLRWYRAHPRKCGHCDTPAKVAGFMHRYDNNSAVDPFTFSLPDASK